MSRSRSRLRKRHIPAERPNRRDGHADPRARPRQRRRLGQRAAAKTCAATSGQGDARRPRRPVADRDDAAVVAARPRTRCAGQQPGRGEQAQRLVVDLHRLADAAHDHDRRRLARPARAGWSTPEPEGLVRLLAQLVQPGDRVAVGRLVGCSPISARILRSTRSHITCSHRQASSWTYSHSSPMTSTQQPLGEPVLAHDAGGELPAARRRARGGGRRRRRPARRAPCGPPSGDTVGPE